MTKKINLAWEKLVTKERVEYLKEHLFPSSTETASVFHAEVERENAEKNKAEEKSLQLK